MSTSHPETGRQVGVRPVAGEDTGGQGREVQNRLILDVAVLNALFAGDRQMQCAVLEEFRRCADPYVEELSVAIAGEDRSGVRALAHKLKSSCRAIGASALGDQCEVLEQQAEDGSWDKLQALELRVQLLMAKVIQAIDAVVDA